MKLLSFRELRLALCTLLAAAFAFAPASAAWAQGTYPTKPIRFIVPLAAGSATDAMARLYALQLGKELGQPLVIDNRAGAASIIGAEIAANAPADGYTLLFGHVGIFATNPILNPKEGFDPNAAFVPVAGVSEGAYVLSVSSAVNVKTLPELVAYAKARPGQLNYGSVGVGSIQHLTSETFKSEMGLDIKGVPYNATTTMASDLAETRIHMAFDNIVTGMAMIQAGKSRPLAVTSPKRSPLLPDVPTMAELGYPKMTVTSWFGVLAPRGTPPEIVSRLGSASVKLLTSGDLGQKLSQAGAAPLPVEGAEFGKVIANDNRRWAAVIKSIGLQPKEGKAP